MLHGKRGRVWSRGQPMLKPCQKLGSPLLLSLRPFRWIAAPWRAGNGLPSLLLQPQDWRLLSFLTHKAFALWSPSHWRAPERAMPREAGPPTAVGLSEKHPSSAGLGCLGSLPSPTEVSVSACWARFHSFLLLFCGGWHASSLGQAQASLAPTPGTDEGACPDFYISLSLKWNMIWFMLAQLKQQNK